MRKLVFNIYRKLFARQSLAGFNRYLYTLSLKGLGVNNYESDYYSGEHYFLSKLSLNNSAYNVFDVGANVGNYANHLKGLFPDCNIFSFEPHPRIFEHLKANCKEGFNIYNFGLGDESKELLLYDYNDEQEGSEHASLYKDVFDSIYKRNTTSFNIQIRTADDFVKENNIKRINLLKSDTEGHDFSVLLGAKSSIENNIIDIIHFEFNSMNTASKVFFKDFFNYLSNFDLYRLLPRGVIKISTYEPVYNEIFGYQNIVAIRKDSEYKNIFS